ncbi:DUF6710 family protein, partial [Klebsiella pneumoniae]
MFSEFCGLPINHRVTLWLPWRIGFVRGGNHSIASGVLA